MKSYFFSNYFPDAIFFSKEQKRNRTWSVIKNKKNIDLILLLLLFLIPSGWLFFLTKIYCIAIYFSEVLLPALYNCVRASSMLSSLGKSPFKIFIFLFLFASILDFEPINKYPINPSMNFFLLQIYFILFAVSFLFQTINWCSFFCLWVYTIFPKTYLYKKCQLE